MWKRLLALTAVLTLLAAACSGSDDDVTPVDTPVDVGIATPTPKSGGSVPPPTPDATPTPTPFVVPAPSGNFPDGPLLGLTPADGTQIASQAVLVRGTAESGSSVLVNGLDTEVDTSGDFTVAVIIGPGENVITVQVTGPDGTRVRHDLRVVGS